MTSTVTVVLPVRNAASTVADALRSLGAGMLHGVDIVAVDDGSDDGTREVLSGLQDELPMLRVLDQDARGIAAALNSGLQEARGTYIARMDADDLALPHRIARQRRFLDQHPQIGVVSGRVRFGGSRADARGYAAYVDWINTLRDPADFSTQRFVESPVAHPAVMFRSDCVRMHGGYRDGVFPEDYEMWLRWMEAGVQFAAIPEEVLLWNDPEERLSRSHPRYSVDAFYALKAEYLARWCEKNVASWPDIIVWGAGRITRKRVQFLVARGARVRMWVDLDAKKIGHRVSGAPVIAPDDLPAPGSCFILPYVGRRNAREEIQRWLRAHGYVQERDYLHAA